MRYEASRMRPQSPFFFNGHSLSTTSAPSYSLKTVRFLSCSPVWIRVKNVEMICHLTADGFDLAHFNTLRIVIAGAAKEADMIGVFRVRVLYIYKF